MLDKAHFDRQLEEARVISSLQNISLETGLLHHTDFYRRFGLGHELNPGNQDWRYFLRGFKFANDPKDWIYRFYQSCKFDPIQLGQPTAKAALEMRKTT